MNKRIRQICQDIRNNRLPEENIPQLFNHMATEYYTYGAVQLAMHYFACYEAFVDEEDTWSLEAKEMTKQVNTILREHVLSGSSGTLREQAIGQIDGIRNEIMKRMDTLTAYTDIFQTYEYILNRVEYRFADALSPIDEEEFAKEILRYIFDTEDNLIINEKIKEIIGQLPIRITKQKYFELLKDSMQAYLGSDKASFDTHIYMLRTSAMLYYTEDMKALYPGLWEKKEFLGAIRYKEITKEDYDKALSVLRAAVLILETEITVFFGLQEIVNEVYALLLCSPYSGMTEATAEKAEKAAFVILREVNELYTANLKQELPDNLYERLSELEGVQEELSYELSTLEDALYTVENNHSALLQGLMLDKLSRVLLLTQKLLSGSLFIDLGEEKHEAIVDEAMLDKAIKNLTEELTVLFDQHDRSIGRAVMANTLSKLPVFFNDHKEVMDYVLYSLERCSDSYEKAAVAEIINAIMSE